MPASSDADFPEGCLFGSSTSAHQVEGGNVNNDWWAWEHTAGTPAVEPSLDAIDREDDLRRVPRPSARICGEFARTRSLSMFKDASSG